MRSPRRFVPSVPAPLEGRLALSAIAPTSQAPAPAETVTDALLAGQTVTDHYTIAEYNGLVETIDQSTVMIKPGTNMVTQLITLPGSSGSEKTVEIEALSSTGASRQYTTIEPNGTVQTEQLTQVYDKTGSTRTGKIERPDGVVISFTGKTVNKGPKSTTTEAFTESNETKYKEDNVSITEANLTTRNINKTTWADGSIQINKSTTKDVRTL
jgi:hypothetical protein